MLYMPVSRIVPKPHKALARRWPNSHTLDIIDMTYYIAFLAGQYA